jgi:hypothetical protein
LVHSYTAGSTTIYEAGDNVAAFSIVDMSEPMLIDYYNTTTDPDIIGDDINSLDVS